MPPASNNIYTGVESAKGGSQYCSDVPFPAKLYEMLDYAEDAGLSDAVSWLPHGRAFKIHNQEKFMSDVANRFFKATKLRSVHRQLNLWGFKRIPSGDEKDSWCHEFFVRGQPEAMRHMVRTKVKGKSPMPVKNVLNFYRMSSAPARADMTQTGPDHHRVSSDEEEEQLHVVTPSINQSRRVSLVPSLPLPNVSSAPAFRLERRPLARRYRYCKPVCNETAEPAHRIIEPLPLPFPGSKNLIPDDNDDEFSIFIDRMISDPSASP